ncbi:unnamed protein product [Vitrella brassicaformis CCMP3155]|uniref:Mitochondrial carrier protein n=1 Tax=Vitrella brassicaformis (strain CCMP3155) TaxID=1169540 RepID=A0A0G4ERH1_VITBC|nr:unnamed protein product [Vitrella brassicaformis CCMP3155]|eukprot:CEL99887.1 unnamed protein product [Vitrella brassicaformis CCMP3155]
MKQCVLSSLPALVGVIICLWPSHASPPIARPALFLPTRTRHDDTYSPAIVTERLPSRRPLPSVKASRSYLINNAKGTAQSVKKQLLSLFAGGMAGTIASSITTPIEVVKTQLQASAAGGHQNFFQAAKAVYDSGGLPAFYRGLAPTLVGIIPARSIYFWGYSTMKSFLFPYMDNSPLTHILSAAVAGGISNTVTNPIWMVRTRLQLLAQPGQSAYKGYTDAVRQIWANEGFGGFMKGVTASYWGISEGCINWVVYERLKKVVNSHMHTNGTSTLLPLPKNAQLFLSAACSKLLATSCTYPHEVVRTRLREQAVGGVYKYTGMLQALRLIAREEGRRGLYAGFRTHLLRVVPNNAILFLSYELINAWLHTQMEREEEETGQIDRGPRNKKGEGAKGKVAALIAPRRPLAAS